MTTSQKSFLQTLAIWAGLILIGIPVVMLLLYLLYQFVGGLSWDQGGAFVYALALAGWLTFWGIMRTLVRRSELRIALLRAAIFLAGVPLAVLLSTNNMLRSLVSFIVHYYYAPNMSFPTNLSLAIICLFLAIWSLLNGLFTRSARGMYVALHLFNWFFWLGIIGTFFWTTGGSIFLIIPLGIMLLLLGFRELIIRWLAILPLLQKSWKPTAMPKPADPPGYEQGYQSQSYKEGGNIYTYSSDEEDAPAAYAPQAETQQQQQ
jgi:hypothetical protein